MSRKTDSSQNDNQQESYGTSLRHRRKGARLSLTQLAETAGITASYLSKVERGTVRPPSPEIVGRLDRALGTTLQPLAAQQNLASLFKTWSLQEGNPVTISVPMRRPVWSLTGSHLSADAYVDRAMTVLRREVESHLPGGEFSFSISGHSLPDGTRELVVHVGEIHRFQIPPGRPSRPTKTPSDPG